MLTQLQKIHSLEEQVLKLEESWTSKIGNNLPGELRQVLAEKYYHIANEYAKLGMRVQALDNAGTANFYAQKTKKESETNVLLIKVKNSVLTRISYAAQYV